MTPTAIFSPIFQKFYVYAHMNISQNQLWTAIKNNSCQTLKLFYDVKEIIFIKISITSSTLLFSAGH